VTQEAKRRDWTRKDYKKTLETLKKDYEETKKRLDGGTRMPSGTSSSRPS